MHNFWHFLMVSILLTGCGSIQSSISIIPTIVATPTEISTIEIVATNSPQVEGSIQLVSIGTNHLMFDIQVESGNGRCQARAVGDKQAIIAVLGKTVTMKVVGTIGAVDTSVGSGFVTHYFDNNTAVIADQTSLWLLCADPGDTSTAKVSLTPNPGYVVAIVYNGHNSGWITTVKKTMGMNFISICFQTKRSKTFNRYPNK